LWVVTSCSVAVRIQLWMILQPSGWSANLKSLIRNVCGGATVHRIRLLEILWTKWAKLLSFLSHLSLKMEAARSSKILVSYYNTSQCHNTRLQL